MLSRVLCATKTSLEKSQYVILGKKTWVHFSPPVCALSPQLPWVEWILFHPPSPPQVQTEWAVCSVPWAGGPFLAGMWSFKVDFPF